MPQFTRLPPLSVASIAFSQVCLCPDKVTKMMLLLREMIQFGPNPFSTKLVPTIVHISQEFIDTNPDIWTVVMYWMIIQNVDIYSSYDKAWERLNLLSCLAVPCPPYDGVEADRTELLGGVHVVAGDNVFARYLTRSGTEIKRVFSQLDDARRHFIEGTEDLRRFSEAFDLETFSDIGSTRFGPIQSQVDQRWERNNRLNVLNQQTTFAAFMYISPQEIHDIAKLYLVHLSSFVAYEEGKQHDEGDILVINVAHGFAPHLDGSRSRRILYGSHPGHNVPTFQSPAALLLERLVGPTFTIKVDLDLLSPFYEHQFLCLSSI